jgi:SWI/SNF-related matrix-associated actin-dependent regulator of chromatin subfamily A member 5
VQTISLLGYLSEYRGISGPHLVAVPKSTLGNWMNEIKRFCPHMRAIRFHGNKEERNRMRENDMVPGKWDICVTSFEMVISEKSLLKKFHWRYRMFPEPRRTFPESRRMFPESRRMFPESRLNVPCITPNVLVLLATDPNLTTANCCFRLNYL